MVGWAGNCLFSEFHWDNPETGAGRPRQKGKRGEGKGGEGKQGRRRGGREGRVGGERRGEGEQKGGRGRGERGEKARRRGGEGGERGVEGRGEEPREGEGRPGILEDAVCTLARGSVWREWRPGGVSVGVWSRACEQECVRISVCL